MKLKEDQTRIKELLKDTITLLCKNGLHYKGGFSVEALIGITLDDDDVFLVSIKESVQTESAKKSSSGVDVQVRRRNTTEGSESEYEGTPKKISRKRPPDSSPTGALDDPSPVKTIKMQSDPDENSDASSANFPSDMNKEFNIKAEPLDDEELVFVKQEGTTSFSSCSQSGQNESTTFPLGTFGSPNANTGLITQGFSFDSQSGGNSSSSNIPGISSWASSQQQGALNSSGHAITSQGSQQQIRLDSGLKGYSCNVCGKVLQGRVPFLDHMWGVHGIGKPITCKCGEIFRWRSTLMAHKKKCTVYIQATIDESDPGSQQAPSDS